MISLTPAPGTDEVSAPVGYLASCSETTLQLVDDAYRAFYSVTSCPLTAGDFHYVSMPENQGLSAEVLAFGYRAGVVLAGVSMVLAAAYLFMFIRSASDLDVSLPESLAKLHLVNLTTQKRMLLQSTAIFVGMSFGFLGFALFLIQAQGTVDFDAKDGGRSITFARLTPGLLVILCATGIVVMAVTYPIGYEIKRSASKSQSRGTGAAQVGGVRDGVVTEDVSDDELGLPAPAADEF